MPRKMTDYSRRLAEVSRLLNDRLRQLKGATIVDAFAVESHGDIWPTLTLKLKDGTDCVVTVQRDAEGNGPGHLDLDNSIVW